MEEELFKIDIDVEDEEIVKKPDYYVDHFLLKDVDDEGTVEEESEKRVSSMKTCWNCHKMGHRVNDCPMPPNRANINRSKTNFIKAQASGSKRYHDNKFSKFRPGHCSSKLREALGLKKSELPRFVYMMRVLGYPPGWLAEARITNSGIKMYNDRGKRIPEPGQEDGEILNKVMKYDVEKLVEYPGFNVPLDDGTVDDSKSLGFPPMTTEQEIDNYIVYLKHISNRVQDMSEGSTDDEAVDMEISDMLSTEIIEEIKMIDKRLHESKKDTVKSQRKIVFSGKKRSLSDEVKRSKKQKNDKVSDDNSDNELEEGELDEESESSMDSCNLKETDDSIELNKTQQNDNSIELSSDGDKSLSANTPDLLLKHDSLIRLANTSDGSLPETPSPRGSTTNSSFGTPNIKSHSPFSKLPSFENFNKDISDVIDFENLPDSLGKYNNICSVLTKIRSYMSSKTNKPDTSSKLN